MEAEFSRRGNREGNMDTRSVGAGRRTYGSWSLIVVVACCLAGGGGTAESQTGPVSVVDIRPGTTPNSDPFDTFGPDDAIEFRVNFSGPVVVTGNPRLMLRIGEQVRSADLDRVFRDNVLIFRYFVDASDRDDDGVSIPADALLLNGGSIKDRDGNDADLAHPAVPDDPSLKVNGRLDAVPAITRVDLCCPGETGLNQSLNAYVNFSEPIYVTGAPQLAIQVGSELVNANLHSRDATELGFEYVVQRSARDADGIGVPADALILNGGSIRDSDGNDADLTHDALPDDPRYTVDGSGGGAPTVDFVAFLRSPASQDTYAGDETIFVLLRFTRQVQVTGTPQLAIEVGERTRRADYLPTLRAAQLLAPGNSFHTPREQLRSLYPRRRTSGGLI